MAIDQVPEYVALYRQAFERYRVVALWNRRQFDSPTPEQALLIARPLRVEGDLRARELAEQLEKACQQSDPPSLRR